MPFPYTVDGRPAVVPFQNHFGANGEFQCRFRIPQAPQYVFLARIHDYRMSNERTIPCGQVDVLSARSLLRFTPDGGCVATSVEEHVIESVQVGVGTAPRISELSAEPVLAYAASDERMLDLLDRWLEAAFVPVAPTANVGFDLAARILAAILHLAPAGWSAEYGEFRKSRVTQAPAAAAAGALRGGDRHLVRDLDRAFTLLEIDPGFAPQAPIGDTAGSTRILQAVDHRTLRIERGPVTGHARLAAASLLQDWAARPGPDRRNRKALVERVLRDCGLPPTTP